MNQNFSSISSYATDDLGAKRHSYNKNQRFNRHKNMDRMRQERHTVEREKIAERSSRRFVMNCRFYKN